MNPIPYNQLFDIDGLKAAIKDAEKSSDEFGITTTESLKISQGAAAALKKELSDINALIGGRTIKLTDESGQQQIVQFAQEVSRLSTQIKQQKQTIDQLTASINQNKQVISDAKAAQALYQAELVKGKLTQQETKNEIANTTLELRKMTIANREAIAAQKELNSVPHVTQISDSAAEVQAYAASRTAGGTNVARSGSAALIAAFNQDLAEGKITAIEYKEAIDRINISQAEFAIQTTKSDVAIEAEIGLIANLNKEIALMKLEKVNIVDPAQLAKQNVLIQEAEAELARLNNVGKVGVEKVGEAAAKSTNYISAAWGGIRKLAYILPGVGIAGILAFATGPIIDYVTALLNGKDALDEFNQKLNATQAALAGSEYTKAVSSVAELTENIKLAKEGFLSKTEVLHEYNTALGSSIGYTDDLDKAEANIVKHGEAFIKMTQLKAAAQLALQASTKSTYEAQQLAERPTDSFKSLFDGLPVQNMSPQEVKTSEANLKAARKGRQDDQVKESQNSANLQLKIFKDLQTQAAKIAKDNHIDFFDGTQDEKTKKALKNAKDGLALLEEQLHKVAAQLQDAIIDDYAKHQGKESENTKKLADQYTILFNRIKDVQQAQKDIVAEAQLREDFKKRAKAPVLKASGSNPSISDEATGLSTAFTHAALEKEVGDAESFQNEIEKAYAHTNKKIFNTYKDRKITLDDYNYKIKVAQESQDDDLYEQQHRAAMARLKLAEMDYGQYSKQYNSALTSLNDLEKKHDDESLRHDREILEKKLKLKQEITSLLQRSAQTVGQATGNTGLGNLLSDASSDIVNGIGSADAIQKVADLATDAVSTYTDFAINSSKQRQAALQEEMQYELQGAGNNAEARARIEQVYNQKIKAEKTKQAKLAKAASAADIIMNTAVAVSKTLAEGGFFLGVPLAAVVGALGAIELGIVLATPIPQFAKGREDGPATFAEVNERGPEALVKGDRVRFANKGKRGVTYLEKGERVIRADKTAEMINRQIAYANDSAENISQSRVIYDRYVATHTGNNNIDYDKMASANADAIGKLPIEQNVMDERGFSRYIVTKNTRIKSVRDRNSLS